MLDTVTGEVVKATLKHEGNIVQEFYDDLPRPVRVGIEATGSMQWFVNLMEELGIECLVGHPAEIRAAEPRKQKPDRRDADLLLRGTLPETVRQCESMDHFPEFMKHPDNRIAQSNQATPGVEGYVFDGRDGSQMAFWTCSQDASSSEHIHDYDEYMIVVQGCYTLIINGEHISVRPGEEYLIPQ
ncbi:MAG TPA: hypothetical protein VKD70_00770, partial [Candidatus Acidoferrum sp.]|nr:hypothetical protein [Candidatus Acidoferrum sp.]